MSDRMVMPMPAATMLRTASTDEVFTMRRTRLFMDAHYDASLVKANGAKLPQGPFNGRSAAFCQVTARTFSVRVAA